MCVAKIYGMLHPEGFRTIHRPRVLKATRCPPLNGAQHQGEAAQHQESTRLLRKGRTALQLDAQEGIWVERVELPSFAWRWASEILTVLRSESCSEPLKNCSGFKATRWVRVILPVLNFYLRLKQHLPLYNAVWHGACIRECVFHWPNKNFARVDKEFIRTEIFPAWQSSWHREQDCGGTCQQALNWLLLTDISRLGALEDS